MKRYRVTLVGLLLAILLPVASAAQGEEKQQDDRVRVARQVLAGSREPREVARRLGEEGARFLGYQQRQVTFVHTGETVFPTRSVTTTVGPDFQPSVATTDLQPEIGPDAGNKTDLTLTFWVFEWRNRNGTYTEQAIISGSWSNTEYRWIDDPTDVIDVRWIVGDLVYSSSTPYDGVQRDQHTNGIASFTVDDQVASWDLFVHFRPASSAAVGRWTNIFTNYTHTWWGIRLSIQLGAGPSGNTGTITINTDARTWTEGTGVALQIGSEDGGGPVTTGTSQQPD
jgi:hypothetical protein